MLPQPAVALFLPCLVDALFPEVGVAMVRVFERIGIPLTYPDGQTCCGACLNICPVYRRIGGHAYNGPYSGHHRTGHLTRKATVHLACSSVPCRPVAVCPSTGRPGRGLCHDPPGA